MGDFSGQEGAGAGSDTGKKADWLLQSDFALGDSRVHQADGQLVLLSQLLIDSFKNLSGRAETVITSGYGDMGLNRSDSILGLWACF